MLWGVVKNEGRCGQVWESVLGWGRGSEEKYGDMGKVWQSVLGCWGGVGLWESVREGVKKCGGM